jgi:hypothetical protein
VDYIVRTWGAAVLRPYMTKVGGSKVVVDSNC